ncbi:MAG TPA: sulfatase-like hydrolase/transferase [Thermoplasmata archaeon]|nr:sulfatase-like hydrolase/transferase [Thermoplasmata archaeon]
MTESGARRPNVLVVVLDCARADDFEHARANGQRLPFLESFLKEGEYYPQTSAPAPWTIPSHASLFTGLYPWEHGCHAKSSLKLSADRGKLATVLSAKGYRTLLLSANHLLSPDLGFSDGFQHNAWAGWWEPYLRFGGTTAPPNVNGASAGEVAAKPIVGRSGPIWRVIKRSSRLAYRYPFILDGVGRVSSAIRSPEVERPIPVSPWIEPTLERWLGQTPRDQPVFCFVNLLETHEPYYPDPLYAPGFASWWRYSRTRQDHVGWLAGRWEPTSEEFAHLRDLYRQTFLRADARLAHIAELFRAAGRWDNTLVVVTSDHGQAFGEQGMLFHMLTLPEALVRVPLAVRRPEGTSGGSVARGWASLVDVAPTVLTEVGEPGALPASGVRLETVLDAARPGPIFSVADGLVWHTIVPDHEKANFSERRKAAFDRILACAHEGRYKVIFDPESSQFTAYDVVGDPLEAHELWAARSGELGALAEGARLAAGRMTVAPPVEASPDVEERLRSWGYI